MDIYIYTRAHLKWSFLALDNQLEEGSRTENLQAQRCRARLNHLESAGTENMSEWNSTRLKRILVDYMLRMSYYDTAIKLAQDSNIQVTFGAFHCIFVLRCFCYLGSVAFFTWNGSRFLIFFLSENFYEAIGIFFCLFESSRSLDLTH